jgi:hypothetical protein
VRLVIFRETSTVRLSGVGVGGTARSRMKQVKWFLRGLVLVIISPLMLLVGAISLALSIIMWAIRGHWEWII